MTRKSLWRMVLIAALTAALSTQAWADQPRWTARPDLGAPSNGSRLQKLSDEIVIGIVVVAVVAVVVTVVLIKHRPQRITGCINSVAHGMRVTDEKDKRSYALSGNAAGVKAGFRMTLEGKRKHDGPALAFETHKVGKDFGACQP